MNKKQIASLPLEIDTSKYQKMVDDSLEKAMRETVSSRISFLFINPAEQSRYDYLKRAYPSDPDLAAGYNFIKELLDKKLIDDKFQKYVEDYAERNFTRILDAALEKALEHKAKAMAFKMTKKDIKLLSLIDIKAKEGHEIYNKQDYANFVDNNCFSNKKC